MKNVRVFETIPRIVYKILVVSLIFQLMYRIYCGTSVYNIQTLNLFMSIYWIRNDHHVEKLYVRMKI